MKRALAISYGALLLLFCLSTTALAQSDSLQQADDTKKKVLPHKNPADTVATIEADTMSKVRRRSPKRAALLAAVLPGAGQIYNKKYWKLPLVYGALGTAGFLYFNNRYWYQQYRTAYINDLEEENPASQYALQGISTNQLRDAADASRRNMEYAMIGFALGYALQILDATVDAHLFYFDVSDDLSLNWSPSMMPSPMGRPQQGLALNLTF